LEYHNLQLTKSPRNWAEIVFHGPKSLKIRTFYRWKINGLRAVKIDLK